MQRVMQNNCAVFRTGEVLDEGVKLMQEAIDQRDNLQVTDDSMIWNSDLVETLELQKVARPIDGHDGIRSQPDKSRGAHAREDYPDRDDDEDEHSPGSSRRRKPTTARSSCKRSATMYVFPPKARVYWGTIVEFSLPANSKDHQRRHP